MVFQVDRIIFVFLAQRGIVTDIHHTGAYFQSCLKRKSPVERVIVRPTFMTKTFLYPSATIQITSITSIIDRAITFMTATITRCIFIYTQLYFYLPSNKRYKDRQPDSTVHYPLNGMTNSPSTGLARNDASSYNSFY